MEKITLKSPAKINLTLDIISRSANGYHQINSIMMPIPLHDTITIVKKPSQNNMKNSSQRDGIVLQTQGLPCPQGMENSAYKAAKLFFKNMAGHQHGKKMRPVITIKLYKRIPLASGLGGGSSNAATTLVALNKLFRQPLSHKKLIQLAAKIGMDTPFFISPSLCLATHFGEKLTAISRKNSTPLSVLLIPSKSKKKSSKHAYEALDISLCNKKKTDTKKLLNFLKNSPLSWGKQWNTLLHNDFDQLYPASSTGHLTGAGPMRFQIKTKTKAKD